MMKCVREKFCKQYDGEREHSNCNHSFITERVVVNFYVHKNHNGNGWLLKILNLGSQPQRLGLRKPWKGPWESEFLISTASNYNAHGLKTVF